jgi:hypothetical protein
MVRSYHHAKSRQSVVTPRRCALAAILLAGAGLVGAGPASAQVPKSSPKDCLALKPGIAETVHEGRYNILCVRPPPGPLALRCRVDGVTGQSALQVYPLTVDGTVDRTVTLSGDGPLPAVDGIAGPDAYAFFSYDGPFYPVRDKYRLTCRW